MQTRYEAKSVGDSMGSELAKNVGYALALEACGQDYWPYRNYGLVFNNFDFGTIFCGRFNETGIFVTYANVNDVFIFIKVRLKVQNVKVDIIRFLFPALLCSKR